MFYVKNEQKKMQKKKNHINMKFESWKVIFIKT